MLASTVIYNIGKQRYFSQEQNVRPTSDTLTFSIILICSLRLLSYLRCEDLSSVCKIKLFEKCFDTFVVIMAFMISEPVFHIISSIAY